MKVFIDNIKHAIVTFVFDFFHPLINSIRYLCYKNTILVNSWVEVKYGSVTNRNWGDDINVYLLEKISKKKIIVMNQSLLHRKLKKDNFICIGSILGLYENVNSIIWGSGFIDGSKKLLSTPKKICSVRGKYTRDILLSLGYNCPAIYGDPALLVSKYYKPILDNKPKYRIGFILHYVDITNDIINDYVRNNSDCIIISLFGYKRWTDVIDKICSCEFILSSSLHGLIVSDSYGIPNSWIRLSDKILGGDFKYLDYFSSVNRSEKSPNIVDSTQTIDILYEKRCLCKELHIDYESILNSCPFIG